jgi:hypothetical protein
MLSVPARTSVGDLTIYADDTDFWRFYAIPLTPRVRADADGDPVFLLLTYALSDEERREHPELPTGGGYLSFDTVFEATGPSLAAARAELQPQVDAEWDRLRNGSEQDRARPGVAGTNQPPRLEFSTPTWTAGSVKLDAPQTDRLVSARVAAGEPSLLAGNVASFNLDLTTQGAQLMEDSLTGDPDQATPLQVAYDLSFWARLPPARIHMEVDSERMHEYVRKQVISRGFDLGWCTTYDYDHSDITEESLVLSGAVTVQIDTGSGSLPDDVIAELRGYAFDTLKQIVQSTFFQPAPQQAPPELPAPGTLSPAIYHFRPWDDPVLMVRDFDKQTMSVSLDLEQSSVVAWPIHPRATLTGLVGDDPAERRRYVKRVALDDPFFADLRVEVEVHTDFGAVDHVEVQLEHSGTDSDGAPRLERTTLTFTGPASQVWSIPLFGDGPTYRSRHRVVLASGQAGPFTEWETSTSRRLVISLESPGVVQADVLAGNVDFERLVASVQVTFAYEDTAHGVPRDERTVVLTRQSPNGTYRRPIGVPKQAPLRYRVRFDLLTGDVIEDEEWRTVAGAQVVVNQPAESVLRVSLLPSGNGWAGVIAVMVDLRHEDPDGRVVTDTIGLRSLDEFQTWQVYLKDKTARAYRYRWTASFVNGDLVKQDWTDNPGDPVLPVTLERSGVDVLVVPDALDFLASPLTEVTLRWLGGTPGGAAPPRTTLLFRERVPQTWHVEVPHASPVALAWTATHFPVDRDPVVLAERTENDPVVVLPAYRPAVPGLLEVRIIGTLVNYTETPIVAVDLAYDDDENGVHATHSVTLDTDNRATGWAQPIKDARAVGFRYRITWFDKTGHPKQGEWSDSLVPRIVIPAAG